MVRPPAQAFIRGNSALSSNRTDLPAEARSYAQAQPAGPAPIMIASQTFISSRLFDSGHWHANRSAVAVRAVARARRFYRRLLRGHDDAGDRENAGFARDGQKLRHFFRRQLR